MKNINTKKLIIGAACIVVGILLMNSMIGVGTVLFPIVRVIAIAAIGFGIFSTVTAFIKKKPVEAINIEEHRMAGDEELNTQIRALSTRKRLFTLLGMVLIAVMILIGVASGGEMPFGTAALLFISAIVLLIAGFYYGTKLKDFISDNIVKQALEDVFDEVTYKQNGRISDNYVHSSNMGLPHFDKIDGNDLVVGKYKGLNIEMSDITLMVEETTTDDEGNEQRHDRDVFRGLWLVCDFEKTLAADMRMWEWGGLRSLNKGIQTENEQFNKLFRIESEIEVEAFYILTPHMMEYILEVKSKAGGHIHMCFARNGKVQIAIDSGRDSFEVGGRENDAASLRAKYVREIRYVTDIIDELRLVDTLYK